jgi:hypothetical protein
VRDAGLSGVSAANAFTTAGPKDFLLDDRAGSLTVFATSESDHYVQIDRGAGTLEAIDRLWIPSGHNFAGADIRVRSAISSDMITGVTTELAAVAAPAGALDFALSSTTKRYVRLDWPNDTGAWEFGELILTRIRTTTDGPLQGWRDYPQHNRVEFEKESGASATLAMGADRRVLEIDYRATNDSLFAEMMADVGTFKPLLIDPPYGDAPAAATEPVVWMKFSEDVRVTEATDAPASQTVRYADYRLRLLEHLA